MKLWDVWFHSDDELGIRGTTLAVCVGASTAIDALMTASRLHPKIEFEVREITVRPLRTIENWPTPANG